MRIGVDEKWMDDWWKGGGVKVNLICKSIFNRFKFKNLLEWQQWI